MDEKAYTEVWEFDGGKLTFSNPDVTFTDSLRSGSTEFPERDRDDVYALYYEVRLELGDQVVFDLRECESMWVFEVAKIVTELMNRPTNELYVRETSKHERVYYGVSDLDDYLGYMYGWYMFKVERYIRESLEDPESEYTYEYPEGFEFVKETYSLTFGAPSDALDEVDTRVEAMKLYGIGGLRRDDLARLCEVAERFCESALKIGMEDERAYVKEMENEEG